MSVSFGKFFSRRPLEAKLFFQLLVTVAIVAAWDLIIRPKGYSLPPIDRVGSDTLIGFLPDSILFSNALTNSSRLIFFVSSFCWLINRLTLIAAPLAAASFYILSSQITELSIGLPHQYNFVCMALLVMSAGIWQSRGDELRNPWNPYHYSKVQEWVYYLLLFYVLISYTFSGLAKMYVSGASWIDSRTILFISQMGKHFEGAFSFFDLSILEYPTLVSIGLLLALVAETVAICGVYSRGVRYFCALVLVPVHLVNEFMFGFGFEGHVAILAFLLLLEPETNVGTPLHWLAQRLERKRTGTSET